MDEHLPDEIVHSFHGVILPDEVRDDITLEQDMHAGYTVTHEPTGISEEYNIQPFARNANPTLIRNSMKRNIVRDHPEILDKYDLSDYDASELAEKRYG